MARIAQPREVAELKGAHKKDPQRYRGEVVKSDYALGNPPEHMHDDAKAIWFELDAYSLPGVLTGSDRLIMEVLSNLVMEYRKDPEAFPAAKHSVVKAHIASLGLTPSARQQFTTDKSKSDNPFADL